MQNISLCLFYSKDHSLFLNYNIYKSKLSFMMCNMSYKFAYTCLDTLYIIKLIISHFLRFYYFQNFNILYQLLKCKTVKDGNINLCKIKYLYIELFCQISCLTPRIDNI